MGLAVPVEANKEVAKTNNATVWSESFMSINSFQANLYLPRALGLIDNWTKPGCGSRAETEYQEVQ